MGVVENEVYAGIHPAADNIINTSFSEREKKLHVVGGNNFI